MSQTFATLRRTNVRDAIYEDAEGNFSALRSNFSGTAYPSSPVVGQKCYRTDLKKYYKWDGTNWVECGNVTEAKIQQIENTLDGCISYEYLEGTTTITLPSSSNV